MASSSKGKAQMELNPRGIPKAPFVVRLCLGDERELYELQRS